MRLFKQVKLAGLCVFWASLAMGQGSQQQQYAIPKIEDIVKIPHSPEAQAFNKYGNTPVNLYTGTPEISIPVATLKGREIEVPISLTYDASGVKVEQMASWVGLNWNLNVGGVVTRNVVGYPDDYISALPYYFPYYAQQVKADVNFAKSFMPEGNHAAGELARYYDIMRHVVSTERYFWLDVEPDTYSFNVLGLSGTLMINYDNNTAYCLDHPEIKVIPLFNEIIAPVTMFITETQQQQIVQQPIKNLTGWEIYDAAGNYYYFNSKEVTTVSGDNNTIDFSRKYNSAFHLTKIISATKKDEILFNYGASKDLDNYQLAGRGDARHDYTATAFGVGNDATIPARTQYYKIGQSPLTDIKINGKTVANFSTEPLYRKDLLGRKALDKIVFLDLDGNQTSSFDFIQSYAGDANQTDEKYFRLSLDRVDVYGTSNSATPQSYTFLYNSGALPPRDSFSMDFWGYFNGAPNNTLIPYDYDLDRYDQVVTGFLGADRRPNLLNTQIGSLRKITYPTKGSTEFNYKLNKAADEAYTRKDDFLYGSSTLIGAIDNTNMCEPDKLRPKKLDGQFTITEGGTYRLSISTTGYTGSLINQIRFLGIYYAGSLTDQTTIQRTGCELDNDIAIPTLYRYNFSDQTSNFSTDFNVVLQPGKYGYALLNSDASTSISFEVVGGKVTSYKDVGGLRITSIIDKDENDQIASKSYYYYNDLSSLSPAAINEGIFATDSYLTSGTLQQELQFHDGVAQEYYLDLEDGTQPQLVSTQYHRRFSENRIRANMLISYPIVSEVKFSGTEFLGVTVMEFINSVENYVFGYKRNALLNGKLKEKRVYDNTLKLLHSEKNYYSQRSNGSGEVGIVFRPVKEFRKDLRIKAPIATPTIEFTDLQDPWWWYTQSESMGRILVTWFESHCPIREANIYNTIRCYTFGADYVRDSYSYGKYWVTLDSTITKDYVNAQYLQVSSKYFYENTNHYQLTRTERTDSKNIMRKALLTYSPEMKALFPTNSIWVNLVAQNRIAEPVKIVATIGSNTPDFVQNTIYKNLAPDYKQIVPDKVQFSSGNGPLEDRVRYHQYDAIGNPIEVSREGDTRISFIWGYNAQMLIAEVKNASSNEIFHTSFEAGEEGGNSADNDSRTGTKSRTGGYSKTLSGLTPNKAYVLTYWQKVSNVWTLQTINIAPSASTSYPISLIGQVDEVRFAPADAMMTTYTHKPGSGIVSSTDANNQTTYFEYDTFNRLHLIRDQNQKILKQHKYNYYQSAN